MNNTQLFAEAIKYYKVREIPGKKNNPLIVEWTKSILSWANDDEVPWCSAFLNAMAEAAGLEKTSKANARSWLDIGIEIDNPVVGDVVVFWRENQNSWKGHVGVFVGFSEDGKNILVLGGNQGNEVNISKYPIYRLLGYRRLRKI